MKVLVDTNVLLSAALRNRLPERVVKFVATHDDWKWVVTIAILAEYTDVLKRPKFNLDEESIRQWTDLLSLRTVNIGNPPVLPDFPRDPSDSQFLAAALFSRADLIITGDKDFLDAKNIISSRIVTVAEFAAEFLP